MSLRGLIICGTPIGNLGDISVRLREVLAAVDVIACEDTRRTRGLLSALEIRAPRLISYRNDNEQAACAGVLRLLEAGNVVALVSDAGMPTVSDPGVPLVRAARAAGVPVTAVPGPSAVDTALALTGLGGGEHRFVGFLPRSARAVSQLVVEHVDDVIVAFEAPGRLLESLGQIAEVQPQRQVGICRELTKLHEEVVVGRAEDVVAQLSAGAAPRGEFTVVLAAYEVDRSEVPPALVRCVVECTREGASMRTICKALAQYSGYSANQLYKATLDQRS